jgi:hypothetical protein
MTKRLWVVCVLGLGGCASDGDEAPGEVELPSDIAVNWTIVNQQCDGASYSDAARHYKLDASHVVRVDRTSQTAEQICDTAFVYTFILDRKGTEGDALVATGVLTAAGTKTVCRRVEAGQPVDPPISEETGTFGPETIASSLTVTADDVVLAMTGVGTCTGTLRVQLAE